MLLNILVENKMLFSGLFVFCSTINVFTVTFDQFNGSLQKNSKFNLLSGTDVIIEGYS